MDELVVHPVDLEPLRSGGLEGRTAVAEAVDRACRDTGFLVLTGHGVPQGVVDRFLELSTVFFDLPVERKRRFVVADPAANRGYTEMGQEALGYTLGTATPPDLFEAMTYGREDAVGPHFDALRSYFAPNEWPDEPVGLREAFLEYEAALRGVADDVLTAMAIALELPEGWFVEANAGAVITTRALLYERQPGCGAPLPDQMRLGAHTDYGVLTLLAADDVPGLQVQRAGSWHDVSVAPGTLLGNIGDLLERWTNDRWHSTLHRVVPPPSSADGPVRRRSIARFLDGDPSMLIECIPSCCSDDDPARYPPVNAGQWLRAKIVGGRTRELVDLPGSGS